MARSRHVACLVMVLCALAGGGCEGTNGSDAAVDASEPSPNPPDASGSDAHVDEHDPIPDALVPMEDAMVARDGDVPELDAGPSLDAGADVDASPCGDASCAKPDLIVELPAEDLALSLRNMNVTEDDCELFEGCVGGTGMRTLIELSFTLRNIGDDALVLGRPFENPLFYPSFCQDSYVIDGFFGAEIRDADGDVVASGRMSTSCIAESGGEYTCRAQGLSPDGSSAQPIGRCDFLDITGLTEGDYTLVVTANANNLWIESNFDNNSDELSFHYTPCDGTVCGGECCPAGVECYRDTCMLPDLRINEASAAGSLWITHQEFGVDSCELAEMCVNGGGRRRLLQFEGRIENWGPGDLNPGPEADNPLYEYSECHGHYHFLDFTDYRLLNEDGTVAALGHKQSFCLIDMAQVEGATVVAPPGTRPPPGETGCSYLSAGWADIYGVGTQCQWVDITDVAPGNYLLQLTVNPENSVHEADTTNNIVTVPVTITEDVPCEPQPEICGDSIDQDCDETPDAWDSDCFSCSPFDPYCEDVEQVTGNDSCAEAHAMVGGTTYEAWIDEDTVSELEPSCGGEGADVFFKFSLDGEQAVYLGTLGSYVDTVLALYAGDCAGGELRCVDDACHGSGSQLAAILPAGDYVVAVKAKTADDLGRVRLKLEHADAHGATVLEAPGVYAGDTSTANDSVQACVYSPDPEPGSDGGVSIGEEECVAIAEDASGGSAGHTCLHCACEIDPDAVAACGESCWALIDCVAERCDGDGSAVGCVVEECSDFLGALSEAQLAASALRQCASCSLSGGGTAGAAGGSAGMGGSAGVGGSVGGAGGMGGGGSPSSAPAPDDIYIVATCNAGLTVSTCGSSMFPNILEVRVGSLDETPIQACSQDNGMCQGDSLGAAVNTYAAPGLAFIVVDGATEGASGEYQMSVIY